MKRLWLLLILVMSIGMISAEACNLNVSLLNQDPYPALPGESTTLLFQITGISNPDCGVVNFEVKENYPFTIDPESENPITINSGTYTTKYSSFYLAPYKIRIDKDALEGDTPIEVHYGKSLVKSFNINIQNTLTDFEIHVKDYAPKKLTLEILNIGEVDVSALTIEIPKQENIEIKGANRMVVGDLDSNEYTTADFEATMKTGKISMQVIYTDPINVRREITKTINFDSSYFDGREEVSQPVWLYVIILVVIAFVGWKLYKKYKKKRLHH